ncbi:MAG: rhamnulokinase family protein [Anaerolineae bacterium]|nr:rhamnulokinase [Anaerolineae bacterium]MDW8100531.1 rhamnulokinase family protein [Anaerolineae bacterium]
MAHKTYLAFDLGASNGRAIAGYFDGERLHLEVIHRFDNPMIQTPVYRHWDVLGLFRELMQALRAWAARGEGELSSVGVDTWGVDFALLGRDGTLLGNPIAYRDPYTEGVMDSVVTELGRAFIFEQTGLQFMPINTLYQLIALARRKAPQLEAADQLLMMPDLFHYFLTGERVVEFTDATTTQCYNPRTGDWAWELIERVGLPRRIFSPVVPPGTRIGTLLRHVSEETGVGTVEVIAPASHDTGSAVAAVPARGEDWAYISLGTWALMGIEVRTPILSGEALAANFTNEGGVDGTYRFLKNITGLWLVQECRRIWAREDGQATSWDELIRMAAEAQPLRSFVDPDDLLFLSPPDMPEAIRSYCRRTGQPVPERRGEVLRCALEGLALKCRYTADTLARLRGKSLQVLHIVGGGIQNRLLCQFIANATGLPVITGPIEATAMGNILIQAMGQGYIGSLQELREVVRRSVAPEEYTPQDTAAWEEAYGRFQRLLTA